MRVSELIEFLQNCDPGKEVVGLTDDDVQFDITDVDEDDEVVVLSVVQ
jgi:hypothetical protein